MKRADLPASGRTAAAVDDAGTAYSFLGGGLAQLQFWNFPLSDDQINALYDPGTIPDGLVAQYSLDEGSGDTVSDSVGGHDDGTVFGGVWDFGAYPLDASDAGTSGGGC